MKLVLMYPPDYDGELHFDIKKIDYVGSHPGALEVKVTISQKKDETVLQTMRRLGMDLQRQPANLYLP